MAKEKDKNVSKKLAEGITFNTASFKEAQGVVIEYVNPPDELGIYAGQDLWLRAVLTDNDKPLSAKDAPQDYIYTWIIKSGEFKGIPSIVTGDPPSALEATGNPICIATNSVKPDAGIFRVTVVATHKDGTGEPLPNTLPVKVRVPTRADLKGNFDRKMDDLREGMSVSLQRTSVPATDDIALWVVIRKSTENLSFANYNNFIDAALYGPGKKVNGQAAQKTKEPVDPFDYEELRKRRSSPFNDMEAYRLLKVATESFLLVTSGVESFDTELNFTEEDVNAINQRMGGRGLNLNSIKDFWRDYLTEANGSDDPMLPYLAIISNKLKNSEIRSLNILMDQFENQEGDEVKKCLCNLRVKLNSPFLLELIWSYWQEEGMLVQTMNAIARRFQNIRSTNGRRDPLAGLEIDTLRPLSNLLWGYVQDEQHRLTIARRDSEYDHQYGMSLKGRAVPKLRSADSRSKFVEALNYLLKIASTFFKQDDDTTVHADGFPLLNALKEVHLVLSQGAHNQFGDLPSTARQEMLIQQWILARPEFREFLPTRNAVAYPEIWMDRVEAMKHLQGWNDTSIIHFHNLAVFGEQILLGIRYGNWSDINLPANAANWARVWRAEIQGYIHAYQAVTGVDLSSVSSNRVDSTPPSVHLYNRLMSQGRRV